MWMVFVFLISDHHCDGKARGCRHRGGISKSVNSIGQNLNLPHLSVFFWLMSLQKNIKDICFEDVEMVSLKFLAG